MALEKELETFRREQPTLLKSLGKFVLIRGDDVVGIYDTYTDALKVGHDTFGLNSFLVNQIEMSPIRCFTRDLANAALKPST